MKKYLAFISEEYAAGGGWKDFYTDSDDLEYLKHILLEKVKTATYTGEFWYHIVDTETGQIVFDESRLDNKL